MLFAKGMKNLFLYLFIACLFTLSPLFALSNIEPKIEIITSNAILQPSSYETKQELYPDFLTVRIQDVQATEPYINATLHIDYTDEKQPFCLQHKKVDDSLSFYLVEKRGHKVIHNNSSIQLIQQADGTFSAIFDLVLDPEGRAKLFSGDYLCNFQVKYNEER